MSLGLKYKDNRHIFDECCGETPYLEYPLFRNTGIVRHGFSTRLGGVSQGCWSSLNLSFDRGDDPEAVRENFRRIGAAIGVKPEDMVLSRQTHTTNVRVMTEQDRGKGMTRERDYTDVDGMITNVPGLCLVTSYADCVPLYFVDPVRKAIGLSHSGWRGTADKMAVEMLRRMNAEYGTDPKDVAAAIGPSIGPCCFQVDRPVVDIFRENFDFADKYIRDDENVKGKYKIDLWGINREMLERAGVKAENIELGGICTMCRPDEFYSHRVMGEARGTMGAFLFLK